MNPTPAPQGLTDEERNGEPLLVGYDECQCILTKYCDGECQPVFAPRAVLERAKDLYANSPHAYRGTRPVSWYQAPMQIRREFVEKARALAAPVSPIQPAVGGMTDAQVDAILLGAGTTGNRQVWFTRAEVVAAVRATRQTGGVDQAWLETAGRLANEVSVARYEVGRFMALRPTYSDQDDEEARLCSVAMRARDELDAHLSTALGAAKKE